MSNKQNRNEVCTCGSGKKYKKCCGFQEQKKQQATASRGGILGRLPGLVTTSGQSLANRMFKVMKQEENTAQKILKEQNIAEEVKATSEQT